MVHQLLPEINYYIYSQLSEKRSTILYQGSYLRKINKAYSVLGIIKRNFIYMEEHTFILLYKSMVCPHVEFANSVWCPYKIGDLKEIEKIQKRATKLVIKLKNKSYILHR